MTSETKVPMPVSHHQGIMGRPFFSRDDLTSYGNARASERDAFWMAKVAELERDAARWNTLRDLDWAINIDHTGDPDSIEINIACVGNRAKRPYHAVNELERIADDLTNPRAGETA